MTDANKSSIGSAVKASLLDLWQIFKGRKPKSDVPVILPPLLTRLNLPPMPSAWKLVSLNITKEQFVANVIREKFPKGIVSRRVVRKISRHYGVVSIPGAFKSAASDPRFAGKRNRHSMLVLATA